jgi:small subunit ribosomal protein S20
MANTAQAKKRARQAEKHRQHNATLRSLLRTQVRRTLLAIEAKDKAAAAQAYRAAVSVIDRVAGKGVIAKNTAARKKSRLNQRLRALA